MAIENAAEQRKYKRDRVVIIKRTAAASAARRQWTGRKETTSDAFFRSARESTEANKMIHTQSEAAKRKREENHERANERTKKTEKKYEWNALKRGT